MKRDPALLRADRLRSIMAMPEYHTTIGAWIEEANRESLYNLTTAKEIHEVHRAQGAVNAMSSLKEQFEKVFSTEQALLEKQQKRMINATKE